MSSFLLWYTTGVISLLVWFPVISVGLYRPICVICVTDVTEIPHTNHIGLDAKL